MSTQAPQQQQQRRDGRTRANGEGRSFEEAASSLQLFAARPEAATHRALSAALQQRAAVQTQLRLGRALAESPRVGAQARSAAALSGHSLAAPSVAVAERQAVEGEEEEPLQAKAASGVVQRKLVVAGIDYTARYKSGEEIGVLMNEIVGLLKTELSGQPELYEQLRNNEAPIGKQLKKWIEDKPGYRAPGEETRSHGRPHGLYGRKEQNRAYANWSEAARGLLGWVEAKPIRRAERHFAEMIYANKTLSVFLDSLINKLYLKIASLKEEGVDPARVDAIHQELRTGISTDISVKGGEIGHYREYYEQIANKEGREELRSGVPKNRATVLRNPEDFSIKAKITLLHDLMEYFGVHQSWNPKVSGEGLLPPETEEQTRVTTQINEQGRRAAYVSVATATTPKERNQARGKGLRDATRDETAESTMLARRLNLPVWSSQSMTAVRMLNLAKWAGADRPELSALALNLFAFWRLEYDHRAVYAYHTLHEVMDMAQNFGVTYIMPTRKLTSGAEMKEIKIYKLETLGEALKHANEQYQGMVGVTKELARRVGGTYTGPNADKIRETFQHIKKVDRDVQVPYHQLESNLKNTSGSEEDNAKLLRQVLFLLNVGMNLQSRLRRLMPSDGPSTSGSESSGTQK